MKARSISAVLEWLILVLSLFGVFLASQILISGYTGRELPCSEGCALIAAHPSSRWFGLSVAIYGFGFYSLIYSIVLLRLNRLLPWTMFVRVTYVLSGAGAVASGWLTYLSVQVIGATCDWCIASAATVFMLLLAHALLTLESGPPTTIRRPLLWVPSIV